jgi:uncharacterized membrane protein
MKTENKILMQQARETLAGKWGIAIGTFALYAIIMIVLGSIHKVGGIINLIVGGPMALGISTFSLSFSRGTGTKLNQIFEGFKRFETSLVAYLIMILFTLLWSLLLIVPGIIASISYSQTFFILVDEPSVGGREAVRRSKKMMNGYKWKYFCLQLRFVGWALLSILTLGIGLLWLVPYMGISRAKFYDDVKGANPLLPN